MGMKHGVMNLVLLLAFIVGIIGIIKNVKKRYENYRKNQLMCLALGIAIPIFIQLLQFVIVKGYLESLFYELTAARIIVYLLIFAIIGGCGILFMKDQLLRNKQLEMLGSIAILGCLFLYVVFILIHNKNIIGMELVNSFSFLDMIKRTFFILFTFDFAVLELHASLRK